MNRVGLALIARDVQLAELARHAHRVSEHGPALVLVTGQAGVGRTALIERFAATHDGLVLRAVAAPWESDHPYGVLDQLLPGMAAPSGLRDAADRLARRVAQFDGTVLAVLDDGEWADLDSLRALASVVRHHPDARLLAVVTAATGDPGVPAANHDILARIGTAEIALPPLSAAQVGELAAAHEVLLHPSMAEQLCGHTGGLARDVVRLLAEVPAQTWTRFDPDLPAPAAVSARVCERLAGCSAEARALAEAAAALGSGTAVRDAALLAGVDDDLPAVLDEASSAGLVRLGPQGLTEIAPADPMVRAAVLAAMGPAAAAATYRRAAELVDDPVRALRLRVAASPVPDAAVADRLDELATERAADGAWAVVASLLSDASRLTADRMARESRLTRAVDALIGAGDTFGAAALVPEVESLRETPLRDAVLGYLAIVRGRAGEAESRLRRAWDLVNVEREPDVAALICQRYVLHALCRCRAEDLLTWADRATSLAKPDTPAEVESAAIRGLGLAVLGRADEAATDYAELAARTRGGAQIQRVVMARGWLNLMLGAVEEARADLASSVPTTFHGGSTRISLWASAWLARAQFVAGEWDEALRTVREATTLLERTGIVLTGPLLHWTAVSVHVARGEWEQAEQALRRTDTGPQDYEIMRIPSCLARAQLAEARAEPAAVLRALRPLAEPWAGSDIDEPGQWPWADLYAHALVRQGRYAEADEFLARHETLAAERSAASARARLAAARGRLLGSQGDPGGARAAFEEALGLLEDLSLPYDRARVNLAYGQTLRRAGKRREADAAMSAARDGFAALDAASYVRRCDRELKAGGRHPTRGDRGMDELTPQEATVSELVARGLSNREVAAELFLSVKTVQYHLTRIYAKLGIRSRAELASRHEQ